MIWGQIVWFLFTLVLSIALAPKPKKPRPAALEDFDFPVAEEGHQIPWIFGECDMAGPNVLWYGDLQTKPIKVSSGFSSTTVGYKYFIGFDLGLCQGPIDAITRIAWGEKLAWSGNIIENVEGQINKLNLFGGDKREGGVCGLFDIAMGEEGQTFNPYLAEVLGEEPPAWRGIVQFIWKARGFVVTPNPFAVWFGFGPANINAQSGYIGTTPYPKAIAVRGHRVLKGWDADGVWYEAKAEIAGNLMNGAHVAYQVLTDANNGMGVARAVLNADAWEDAADQLFDEGFGLSLKWAQETPIEDFLQVVLDHIAADLVLSEDGEYHLLLVRGGYDVDALPVLTASEVDSLDDLQVQGWGETVNEVTLLYTDPDSGKDTTITMQDAGNFGAQGVVVPATVELRGIRSHAIARQVCARELASRTTPLRRVKFTCNRAAQALGYGSRFRLVWTEEGRVIPDVVFRVLQIGKGKLTANTISVDAVEDIYAHGLADYIEVTPPAVTPDPEQPPPPELDDTPPGSVLSATTEDPPADPDDGDAYLIPPAGGTGLWADYPPGTVVTWDDSLNLWVPSYPAPGSIVWVVDDQEHVGIAGDGSTEPAVWTPAIAGMTISGTPDPATTYLAALTPAGYRALRVDQLTGIQGAAGFDPRLSCRPPVQDFIVTPGSTGQDGWDAVVDGTNASVAGVSEPGHPGIVRLRTGTTSSGTASVMRSLIGDTATASGFRVGGGPITCHVVFKHDGALPVNVTNMAFSRLGLASDIAGIPSNGIYFTLGVNSGGDVVVVGAVRVADSTTATDGDDGLEIALDDWYHGRFVVNAAGTSVEFFIAREDEEDEVSIGVLAITLPSVPMAEFCQYDKSTGTTSLDLWVDVITPHQEFTVPRWQE